MYLYNGKKCLRSTLFIIALFFFPMNLESIYLVSVTSCKHSREGMDDWTHL